MEGSLVNVVTSTPRSRTTSRALSRRPKYAPYLCTTAAAPDCAGTMTNQDITHAAVARRGHLVVTTLSDPHAVCPWSYTQSRHTARHERLWYGPPRSGGTSMLRPESPRERQKENSGPLEPTDRTRVELRGLEPLTSSLPVRRATNRAIAPCGASAPRALTTVQHCRHPGTTGGDDNAAPLTSLLLAAEQILEPVRVVQRAQDLALVRHHRSAEPA